MKNLEIGKRALALATALGITAISYGCLAESLNPKKGNTCGHLIVQFGDQSVIFKECEGYDITYDNDKKTYNVSKDGNVIINGHSYNTNYYESNHEYVDEIEEMVIEKGAYVYKRK